MGWFGGSSETESTQSSDFTSSDELNSAGFSSASSMPSSSMGGSGMGGIEEFSMVLQQQLLVQQAVSLLTDKAFEKCILGKPSDNLSSREAECIRSVTGKWLDTNEFMMGRLQRKAEKQMSASGGMMS